MSNAALANNVIDLNDASTTAEISNDASATLAALNRVQAVIEFKMDGTVISANENFLGLLGYSLDEIQGKHHRMFCDAEFSGDASYQKFWENLGLGKTESGEFKRIGKSGREVWIMASYTPVLDAKGKPYKVVKFAFDMTAAKAELRARTDIMNLTSIVSEADLKGDILSVNDKFCEVSKYSKEELIGQPHNTTRHPDMPKEVFKELWSTIGRGKMFRGVIKNRAKDGTPYYVDAVIAPIMGQNGKPRKYLGVRYDITAAEVERHNMRGVVRAINDSFAYIEFDTSGNVLTANKIFSDVMGFTSDDLKQRHHRTFCEEAYAQSAEYAQFWPDLKQGKSKAGVFKRLTKSGKEVWLQAVYSPVMDETGRVMKVVKIATDVSDQQKMIFSVREAVTSLSSASAELTATATEMENTSNRTSDQAVRASAASDQVAVGVQTVATNMEEMVASIKEIARSTSESSQMAKTTLERAKETNSTIIQLGNSSQEIGDVIKVISSIAQQTNLLALNATIEAARAGEAGRGFAVVANEVKELAKQTAKATNEITNKIGAIQNDTQKAVGAIGGISEAVDKLNAISSVIAAAVEEQTATTNEVSRVVVQSRQGVESISATVKNVSGAAAESKTAASQTLTASKELTLLAERLNALVRGV